MKSKTSESFIASESNGVKRDQELKQKTVKKGKESTRSILTLFFLVSYSVLRVLIVPGKDGWVTGRQDFL